MGYKTDLQEGSLQVQQVAEKVLKVPETRMQACLQMAGWINWSIFHLYLNTSIEKCFTK